MNDDARRPGRTRGFTADLWNRAVAAYLAVGIGICAVMYGVLMPYGYWVGTPAKASVDHCAYQGGSRDIGPELTCTGTWSVRGQSQTGQIKPPFHDDEQNGVRAGKSVLDVRVHDGAAYTKYSLGRSFYVSLAVGAGALVWGSLRLRTAWRNRS